MAVGTGVVVALPASGQIRQKATVNDGVPNAERTMLSEFPGLAGVPPDKQAHFYVSAKFLRLTDLGKTVYGTAMIDAEQVRYRGMQKELSDVGLNERQIATNLLTQIASQKLQTICMIDDLIMYEGLDDEALSKQLADFLRAFDPVKRATHLPPLSWKIRSKYGNVVMQWYAEQRCWFETELTRQGLDAAQVAAHPIIEAFDVLTELTRAEDGMVAALELDQGDLLYDFGGITCGLIRNDEQRVASLKQALNSRGTHKGLSAQEFFDRFLKNDVFAQATHDLPEGLADGTISTHLLANRYVVSSNLPQEPHTILANGQVTITYHPIKDEPWMGVISTVAKVPRSAALQLAKNLYDPTAVDPVHPPGQQEAMARAFESVQNLYADAVRKSGILSRKMEIAQAGYHATD